jgi:hypothetical protein
MVGAPLSPITLRPLNSAADSKGSIHDDAKAREMGYRGGLVPGVTVLGYMSRLMQETYGAAWQTGSEFNGRLRRPCYEGSDVVISGVVVESPSSANGNRVTVELKVIDEDGVVVAFAEAKCQL